jgi:hypothetical protein
LNKAINANKLLILSWQTRLKKKQFDQFFVLLQTEPTITERKKTRLSVELTSAQVYYVSQGKSVITKLCFLSFRLKNKIKLSFAWERSVHGEKRGDQC